ARVEPNGSRDRDRDGQRLPLRARRGGPPAEAGHVRPDRAAARGGEPWPHDRAGRQAVQDRPRSVELEAVTTVAVVSDTHLPRGPRPLPERCVELLRGADPVLHAGDVTAADVLDSLRSLGPPVEAVYGNMDDAELRAALPKERVVEVGETRIGIVHI